MTDLPLSDWRARLAEAEARLNDVVLGQSRTIRLPVHLVEQVNKAMEAADASIAQLQRSAEKLAQAPSTDEVRAALDRLSAAVR